MAEYIEREALLKNAPFTKFGGQPNEYNDGYLDCAADARKAIRSANAADVVEVRHGEWEVLLTAIIDTIGKCTNCGGEAVWRTRLKPYTICPHCCAKMDGKGEG